MYQRTIIVGRLGQDPEMRYTAQGVPVTNFSVAVGKKWKDRQTGEQHEETTWFKVSVWRAAAEACNEYLSKGSMVLVDGEINVSAWTGNDGNPRATLELNAQSVKFLSSRQDTGAEEPGASATYQQRSSSAF